MKHEVVLEGDKCRLRPVSLCDAEFIVRLRNMAHARGNIGDTENSVEKQVEWLRRYEERKGDYYWIIVDKTTGTDSGTYGLYDIADKTGVPGRWIQVPKATYSVLEPTLLVYNFAFNKLELERLVFNVVSTNLKVVKYHKMLGAKLTREEKDGQKIGGKPIDFVWFEMTPEIWTAQSRKWAGKI